MGESTRASRVLGGQAWSALALSMACVYASAADFAGGTGTTTDPYRIATASQLISVGSDPNLYDKHFVLANDINLDPTLPGGKVFTHAVIAPSLDAGGNSLNEFVGTAFTGSFDGRGHVIKNLTIRSETGYYLGLFGKTGKNAEIRNLTLEEVRISLTGAWVSGLVGYNRGSITGCRVTGIVSGGAGDWCSYVGLVAGKNRGCISHCAANGQITPEPIERGGRLGLLTGENSGIITHCVTDGVIKGGDDFGEVGGLAGSSVGVIADCHANSGIFMMSKSGGSGRFAGLAGANEGSIHRSYATGRISCGIYSGYIGGLVGYNTGVIVSSYARDSVVGDRANSNFGGLAGMNRGHIVYGHAMGDVNGRMHVGGLVGENSGSISQCHATGQVVGGTESWLGVGGLVGDNRLGDVACSFWDSSASGMAKSQGGTGLTTVQMKGAGAFLRAGWDFASERANGTADMWLMPQDEGTPLLTAFSPGYQPRKLQGSGTPNDPYSIATPEDLGAICQHDTGACYKLVADINLAGVTWTVPVIPSFEGRFDGNGFTVSNLDFRGGCFLGLFGVVRRDAIVEKLQIDKARIVAKDSASALGLLAAENYGRIVDCRVVGVVTGGSKEKKHAGVVGQNYGTITNCDPIGNSGPYTAIIRDRRAAGQFLKYMRIRFDHVWIPEAKDLDGLDTSLKTYLDSDTPIKARTQMDREYILRHFRQYNREYSGCRRDGVKYVVCQMHLFYDEQGTTEPHGRFTIIMDGGCGVVTLVFDAETKTVVSIDCNGEA